MVQFWAKQSQYNFYYMVSFIHWGIHFLVQLNYSKSVLANFTYNVHISAHKVIFKNFFNVTIAVLEKKRFHL